MDNAGRCCESGDLIQKNVSLPETKRGDFIAVETTGAYNYSMASNYNRLPRPAVIMLDKNEEHIVVRRETFGDILDKKKKKNISVLFDKRFCGYNKCRGENV